MPRAPAFWDRRGLTATLLRPASRAVAVMTARRVARPGWRAPVPVICCGNVTVGGAGKTTLALDLVQLLAARGIAVHALLRGYGGRLRGPHRVAPGEQAVDVGDEALLLAGAAPTWIGGDRAASARAAVAAGAEALVLDDGLQNPTLAKDLSLLAIDGATGFGNGFVLPAGPLREPVAAGAARCRAAVLIGDDRRGAAAMLPPGLPILRARLHPSCQLNGEAFLAFAGIAYPEKFFATAEEAGARLLARKRFPDHHRFVAAELAALEAEGARRGARLLTTAKDAVRLPPDYRARVAVLGVALVWDDPTGIAALLAGVLRSR